MQKERTYYEELNAQKNPYEEWIKVHEGAERNVTGSKSQAWERLEMEANEKGIQLITYQQCMTKAVTVDADILLFVDNRGIPSSAMIPSILEAFQAKDCQLVYGDEDHIDQEGKRTEPWFKPEWSPDTLASYLYFGSAFAVKKEMMQGISVTTPYQIALAVTNQLAPFGKQDREVVGHRDCIWYHAYLEQGEWSEEEKEPSYDLLESNQPLVSIIIPSKDQPEILTVCLSTLHTVTSYSNYEIIVVDNGSTMEHKQAIEALQQQYPFRYCYVPMEFNFSAMCNLGAKEANGDYVLFLNDDIEIIQKNWLDKMLAKASLSHVGAVGAKLLYPESDKIQHVGVTNLKIGPGHKLTTVSDEGMIYHGANCRVLNMLAVTAACLLVKKEKYELAGGFCEELKVAYNDVDFCFTLYELGFYNVQHNGVTCYHHESLSRGDDSGSKEKYNRLLVEKDKLYNRHPALYQKDPFYSRQLATNSLYYTCNYLFPYEDKIFFLEPDKRAKKRLFSRTKLNLHYHIDCVELEPKMETKDREHYLISGWSFLREVDNATFKTFVLLENEQKKYWRFPVSRQMRKDVMSVAQGQTNAELSGFVVRFKVGEIQEGTYRIFIMKKNLSTGRNHYFETESQLEINK